jgi:hypothetical protein
VQGALASSQTELGAAANSAASLARGMPSAEQIRCNRLSRSMSPTWIWLQVAIVVFVLIGMIVAITKLA